MRRATGGLVAGLIGLIPTPPVLPLAVRVDFAVSLTSLSMAVPAPALQTIRVAATDVEFVDSRLGYATAGAALHDSSVFDEPSSSLFQMWRDPVYVAWSR